MFSLTPSANSVRVWSPELIDPQFVASEVTTKAPAELVAATAPGAAQIALATAAAHVVPTAMRRICWSPRRRHFLVHGRSGLARTMQPSRCSPQYDGSPRTTTPYGAFVLIEGGPASAASILTTERRRTARDGAVRLQALRKDAHLLGVDGLGHLPHHLVDSSLKRRCGQIHAEIGRAHV